MFKKKKCSLFSVKSQQMFKISRNTLYSIFTNRDEQKETCVWFLLRVVNILTPAFIVLHIHTWCHDGNKARRHYCRRSEVAYCRIRSIIYFFLLYIWQRVDRFTCILFWSPYFLESVHAKLYNDRVVNARIFLAFSYIIPLGRGVQRWQALWLNYYLTDNILIYINQTIYNY